MKLKNSLCAVTASPTARVRTGCRAVAQQAQHVTVESDRLPAYARSLSLSQVRRPQFDSDHHYLGRGDDTVVFILTLDTINFGSGYFPHLRKKRGLSGYYTIASSLTGHFNEYGPFSAAQLCEISQGDCTTLFGQDPVNPVAGELMGLFAQALNGLGLFVRERFEGSFSGVVEAAGGSVERLIEILAEMPFFRDVATHNRFETPFYKRAQLTAADLSLAFEGGGPGRFDDLGNLTMFADNLVPHVLRTDGLLRYDPGLAEAIEAGDLIPSGSQQEIEIRACALDAVERLVEELGHSGEAVTAMQLDYFLWTRGQQRHYKSRPRHRTRCVFY